MYKGQYVCVKVCRFSFFMQCKIRDTKQGLIKIEEFISLVTVYDKKYVLKNQEYNLQYMDIINHFNHLSAYSTSLWIFLSASVSDST